VSQEWYALISDPNFLAAHKVLRSHPFIVVSFLDIDPPGACGVRLLDMDGNVVRVLNGIY
jgi:hypothetical protein